MDRHDRPFLTLRERRRRGDGESFGYHLGQWRRARNMTQSAVAKEARISVRTLSRIEAGDQSVSLAAIFDVARVLGIERNLIDAADPAMDPRGIELLGDHLPSRVRPGGRRE